MTEDQIVKRLQDKKGNVVAIARLPNPLDAHVRIVCIEIRPNEYAVWTCTTEGIEYNDCGCYNGEYFTTPVCYRLPTGQDNLGSALKAFADRLTWSL
jgi:hypothetical protein